MVSINQQTIKDGSEISLLREWLPKISGECRAFIKGSTQALLYVQEIRQKAPQKGEIKGNEECV
jgi:hypothetical protein